MPKPVKHAIREVPAVEGRGRLLELPPIFPEAIDVARDLLDRGQPSEAESKLQHVIKTNARHPVLVAEAHRLISIANEMRGRFGDAFAAVAMYEPEAARRNLDAYTDLRLQTQIAATHINTNDYPKAIALAKAALRIAKDTGLHAEVGAVYVVLARAYRSINENAFAREYIYKALECYRNSGDWRGMAEAYSASSNLNYYEGDAETSLSDAEQVLKLVGDRPAAYLLSRVYGNMAGASQRVHGPLESVRLLEKAIDYYNRTELAENAVIAFGNLGYNLIVTGEWQRAQAMLEHGLTLASKANPTGMHIVMLLDSLGELATLREDYQQAAVHLEQSATLLATHQNKHYIGVCARTAGRLHLATGDFAAALDCGRKALAAATEMNNKQAAAESHLLLAEIALAQGDLLGAKRELHFMAGDTTGIDFDVSLTIDKARLEGLLAVRYDNPIAAIHHFGRSLSAAEMRADKYRTALAHLELGQTHARAAQDDSPAHATRAIEHLRAASEIFHALGVRTKHAATEAELAVILASSQTPRSSEFISDAATKFASIAPPLIERLTNAAIAREFLLRELAACIKEETIATQVIVFQPDADGEWQISNAHGTTAMEAERVRHHINNTLSHAANAADALEQAKDSTKASKNIVAHDESSADDFALRHVVINSTLKRDSAALFLSLNTKTAAPALLYVAAPEAGDFSLGKLRETLALEAVWRVAELGLEACALRERVRGVQLTSDDVKQADVNLMPGFIHSSPAMRRLVEEIHRIRSSNVTVLITGESGTGKELVARAVHSLSNIRDKIFVPFNCTAIPKELSEAYLFGYKRGSFTGAIADSSGVIRSAQGGTLFLDEVGDLPIDLQPKLLRFLQEGEIQPLGEQKPVHVEVRIIAATNTNLERMVEEGKFREDLYYRLNVIRLQVPPLRERRSEIPVIINYYVAHYAAKFGRRDISIDQQAIDLLTVADWAGNVRQLCNEIQRIVARAEDNTKITPDHLSIEHRRTSAPAAPPAAHAFSNGTINNHADSFGGVSVSSDKIHNQLAPNDSTVEGVTLADALNELELRMIVDALARHKNNISRAARDLGLTRRGLYLKLERHSLGGTQNANAAE